MAQSLKTKARRILDRLERRHPDARIYLDFDSPFQLLVATVLAAQCTDERVNQVTPVLFQRFPAPADIARASVRELQKIIRSTGFFRRKATSIKEISEALLERFDGEVPDDLDDLTSLPGVGRKTANVVLSNAFGQQAIAVDTHVQRVSTRLGLAARKNPDMIEAQLCEIVPQNRWTRATLLMGTHGRRICIARKPLCDQCPVRCSCDYYQNTAAQPV